MNRNGHPDLTHSIPMPRASMPTPTMPAPPRPAVTDAASCPGVRLWQSTDGGTWLATLNRAGKLVTFLERPTRQQALDDMNDFYRKHVRQGD